MIEGRLCCFVFEGRIGGGRGRGKGSMGVCLHYGKAVGSISIRGTNIWTRARSSMMWHVIPFFFLFFFFSLSFLLASPNFHDTSVDAVVDTIVCVWRRLMHTSSQAHPRF